MNPFRRNIGIWFDDGEWRKKVFTWLREEIPDDWIDRVSESKYNLWIRLKDETIIKFAKASENSKGCKFHVSYLQPGIQYAVYRDIIRPCTSIAGNSGVFILEDVEDLRWPRVRAEDYYRELAEDR